MAVPLWLWLWTISVECEWNGKQNGKKSPFMSSAKNYSRLTLAKTVWMLWNRSMASPLPWCTLPSFVSEANKFGWQHNRPCLWVLDPAAGDSNDWYVGTVGFRFSYTIELRDQGYGFLLPEDQIIPSGQEMWAAFQVGLDKVLEVIENP